MCGTVAVFPTLAVLDAVRTGEAMYAENPKLPATEHVTRASQPEKFQKAVMVSVYQALFMGGLSSVSFYFYRRLSE